MTRIEIASLERSGRAAFAWARADHDGRMHSVAVLAALIPAAGILTVAVTMLLTIA